MAHTITVVSERESWFPERMENHELIAVVDDHMGHLLGLAPEHVAVVGTHHLIHDLSRVEDILEMVGLSGLGEIHGFQRNLRTEELCLRGRERVLVGLPDGLVVLELFGDGCLVAHRPGNGKRHCLKVVESG